MNATDRADEARKLIPAVTELRNRALALEQAHQADLQLVARDYLPSARNLLHYLALRQTDIRPLQAGLVSLGLTSLGNTETAVLYMLDTVIHNLHLIAGEPYTPPDIVPPVDFRTGPQFLDKHTIDLLGDTAGKRRVRIMVTMPSEAATNGQLIDDLLAAGMDAMRINCAHDDQRAWLAMVQNLRRAENRQGRSCKVYADLAGPKLRTGTILPAGKIVRYRPQRNHRGVVVEMCCVWLTPSNAARPEPEEADVTLPIDDGLLPLASVGDEIRLVDARGRRRKLQIIEARDGSFLAVTDRTHYAETGMPVQLRATAR